MSFAALWQAMRQGAKAVPAVSYAIGLAGIAAAFAFIRTLFGDVSLPAMLPLLVGAILIMAVLAIFASALPRQSVAIENGRRVKVEEPSILGKIFLWAVCIFVIIFMVFTVTAVAVGWPRAWAYIMLPREAAERSLSSAITDDYDPVVSTEGYAYYGRQTESVRSDDGKLEPADNSPMPRYQDILIGARLRTVEQVNLREKPTSSSQSVPKYPIPPRRCVEVLQSPSKPVIDLPPESGGWLYVRTVSCPALTNASPAPRKIVVVVDSPSRADVMESISGALSNSTGVAVDAEPRGTVLDVRAEDIANKQPAIVIVHWHAFRMPGTGLKHDREAEADLITFLALIKANSPSTRFVVYSSAFAGSKGQSNTTIRASFVAAAEEASVGAAEDGRYRAVAESLDYIAWSPGDPNGAKPGAQARERDALRRKVEALLASETAQSPS